jgi:PadR family transcriptional regulator PadR
MLKELGRHGHGVSYGRLYLALHRMEEDGLLEREDRVEGGRARGSNTPRRRRAYRSWRGCDR